MPTNWQPKPLSAKPGTLEEEHASDTAGRPQPKCSMRYFHPQRDARTH